jgi:hypothetical protein
MDLLVVVKSLGYRIRIRHTVTVTSDVQSLRSLAKSSMRSSPGKRPTTVSALGARQCQCGDMYTTSQPEKATREDRLATRNSMIQGGEHQGAEERRRCGRQGMVASRLGRRLI